MKSLYQEASVGCSKLFTHKYSTSFSLGINMLHPKLRKHIRAIYGFVRIADEIVDTFHEYDKEKLLKEFREDTFKAISTGISTNPILQAFQHTVNTFSIDLQLIHYFLDSMEMDLYYSKHPNESYNQYIYGSAEVVGLMCLMVFCEGDQALYQSLEHPAKRLGAAFQKINFLRDLKSDIDDRGRIYFPNLKSINHFDITVKKEIENDIQADFDAAYLGVINLPNSSRFGVYIAYIYFLKLFQIIKSSTPCDVLKERIRVSNPMKLWLLTKGFMRFQIKSVSI